MRLDRLEHSIKRQTKKNPFLSNLAKILLEILLQKTATKKRFLKAYNVLILKAFFVMAER